MNGIKLKIFEIQPTNIERTAKPSEMNIDWNIWYFKNGLRLALVNNPIISHIKPTIPIVIYDNDAIILSIK